MIPPKDYFVVDEYYASTFTSATFDAIDRGRCIELTILIYHAPRKYRSVDAAGYRDINGRHGTGINTTVRALTEAPAESRRLGIMGMAELRLPLFPVAAMILFLISLPSHYFQYVIDFMRRNKRQEY